MELVNNKRTFWWVNHKKTFNSEIRGGYIWSPKSKKNGDFYETYDNLTKVRPGDLVISYANTLIKCIGIATASANEHEKPSEFGHGIGENWSNEEGWQVLIEWINLPTPIQPKSHIEQITPLLPSKNSPLRTNGNGNQNCYLASISLDLGMLILVLAGHKNIEAIEQIEALGKTITDDLIQKEILESERQPTEKEQLIRARQGQGLFRKRVMTKESKCRVTGVTDERFLIASHIKPWRDSNDDERLDGENGFLMAPHVDKLFDKGLISFTDTGDLLATEDAAELLIAWHINPAINVGTFTNNQRRFLRHHRKQNEFPD